MTELITQDELNRFAQLREDLLVALKKKLGDKEEFSNDRLGIEVPLVVTEKAQADARWGVSMDNIVYSLIRTVWVGSSLSDALDKAEKDIREWIAEVEGERNAKASK